MATGKLVSLRVRPSEWTHLSFEVDGTLGKTEVQLGTAVAAFDFEGMYGKLGTTVVGSPAQLFYDSTGISEEPSIIASLLCELRAESRKALLDAAVASRENSFYRKYANQAAIIAQMQTFYSNTVATSKPVRLAALSAIAQSQVDQLFAAYSTDGRLAVVKNTTSSLSSTTDTSGESTSNNTGSTISNSVNNGIQNGTSSGATFSLTDDVSTSDVETTTLGQTTGDSTGTNLTTTFGTGFTTTNATGASVGCSTGRLTQAQYVINTDYGYRVPSLESAAQNHRAQISLIDEQFAQFMNGQSLPFLDAIFNNELKSIDLGVKRLQVAYLDTLLMSPIDGTVTGIYKHPGDRVKAGEPVVRVENSQTVLLVGTIIFRGLISLGDTVTIKSTLFGATTTTTIAGTVVAVRGNKLEESRWDLAIECNNVGANGTPIVPLHYHFDYADTSVTVS